MADAGASTSSTGGSCSAVFPKPLQLQVHGIVPPMSGEEVLKLVVEYTSEHFKVI